MKTASIAVGNKRLLKLAAFLRKLPRNRFDYATFVGEDWAGAQDLSCGTTACAFGWAATMPEFRRLGLKLGRDGYPVLPGHSTYDSILRVFGSTSWDGLSDLFYPDWTELDAAPIYVARKIERFVKARS